MCVVETRKEQQKQPHFSSSSLFPQPVTSPPSSSFLSAPPPLPYFIYAYPQFPFSLPPPRPHEKCGLSSLSSSPLFPSPLLLRRQRPIYPGLSGILSLPPSSSSLLVNESIAIVQRRGPRRRRRHHSTSHFSSFLFWFRYQYTVMMIPGAPQKKFFLHGRKDLQNLPNPQPPTLLTFFLFFGAGRFFAML